MNDLSSVVAVSALVGALIGYLGAVATFKAQFVRVDERHNALKDQIQRDREADATLLATRLQAFTDTLARIEQQQRATMQLAANIARAAGVKHRTIGEDAVSRFLSEENEG